MSLNSVHRDRALCFILIFSFLFPHRFSARNLPEKSTSATQSIHVKSTSSTESIHVSNVTLHDFSRLLDVQLGSHVIGVSELKKYLHRFGYVKDDEDGLNFSDVFDGKLENAISLYQRNFDLPITGKLDASTVTLMSSPRCGVSDTHMIEFHTTAHYTYFNGKPKWNHDKLTYAFSKTHKLNYLSSNDVKSVFNRAFAQWSNVIRVSFFEIEDFATADLKIGFYSGDHGDGQSFDGVLGTLAHAFAPENGRLHFDAAERWLIDDDSERSKVAVDLESVAIHEIGHLLGLGHSSMESAVMYPSLKPRMKKVELTVDDVAGVLKLYGPNPKLRLDSLTVAETSIKNESWRFLSGNFTGCVVFLVLILLITGF